MLLNKILLLVILVSSLFSDNHFNTMFNYFGNLNVSQLNSVGYHYNNYNHDSVTNDYSLSPYSKAGAQINHSNDNWSFTAQGLLRENQDKLRAELTWLNVKYRVNDNFNIRVGRIQTKVMLQGESLDIDYVQLWDEAPTEVYRLMPIRTYNGVEFTYDTLFNDYSFHLSIVPFGFYKGAINGNKDRKTAIDISDARSISFTVQKDSFTYKASFSRSKADISDDAPTLQIVDALSSYGNDMSRFTYKDRIFHVGSLGFRYTGDNFSLDAEAAYSKSGGFHPDSKAAYIMLGYRIDKFTPFLIFAKNKNDKEYYNTSSIAVVDPTSQALKRALDDILYLNNYSQSTVSLGFRYDIKPGICFKSQVNRVKAINYGNITPATAQSVGYEKAGILSRSTGIAEKAVYVYSMGLSFAF